MAHTFFVNKKHPLLSPWIFWPHNMKRTFFFFLCCVFAYSASFAQHGTSPKEKKELLYSLYDDFVKNGHSEDIMNAQAIANTVRQQFEEFPQGIRSEVVDLIRLDVISAFEEENNSAFLSCAERALFLLPQEEPLRFDILSSMVDVYIAQDNKELAQATINQMRCESVANTRENLAIVKELQASCDKLMAFPSGLNGYWIADRYMTANEKKGRPWVILDIYSDNNGKWATISELSGISSYALEKKYSPLRKSDKFSFDVRRGTFSFSFYTNKTHQGDEAMAHSMINSAQDSKARFHALAGDNRATVGQAASAEIVGGLTSAMFEAMALHAANSKMSEDVVFITGYRKNNDALNCNLTYQYQATNSRNMQTTTQEYINQDFTLYRWNPDDNLIFGLRDCRPISPYVTTLTQEMELYRIKKQTSFWQFKYGGVAILGMAAGAACTFYGIKTLTDNGWKAYQNEYGVSEAEARKMYKEAGHSTNMALGIIASIVGPAITITVPIVEHSIRTKKREKAVGEYNMREFDKLYKYYQNK